MVDRVLPLISSTEARPNYHQLATEFRKSSKLGKMLSSCIWLQERMNSPKNILSGTVLYLEILRFDEEIVMLYLHLFKSLQICVLLSQQLVFGYKNVKSTPLFLSQRGDFRID